ncbi:MAG: LL-diaminopimelate aminotransferase [Eubacteriales bacterium SKADARSKE-1]|nr:LL-diaminopimelate aminotransferase [Eubacteriales bacterium SKADARSKE-1]
MKINKNHLNLVDSYLFSKIGKKVADFSKLHPDAKIIKLGIGDVTLPLCSEVIKSMQNAVLEMSKKETFKGYGPEHGYEFLRSAIKDYYLNKKVNLDLGEIFVNNGVKSDIANILGLFDKDNIVLIPDPVYPAYVDANVMGGRIIKYIDATEENKFLPLPDENVKADIIYICSPNNPTGAVYNHKQLKVWVDYAISNKAVILFDAAYEAFISDKSLPSSIFEIDGAKKCAIEFCSLSKTAGFTGTRCGYTVIPYELELEGCNLNKMWERCLAAKFNGVSYIVQKGAAAIFTDAGQNEVKDIINYYKENAKIIASALEEMNIFFTGGKNSPYIWLKCPGNMKSWDFFDYLLNDANVAGTPGSGFGKNGEGFFRLTAFGDRENTIEAVNRIKNLKF